MFLIVNHQTQLKCLYAGDWLNKPCYVHIVECSTDIRKNEEDLCDVIGRDPQEKSTLPAESKSYLQYAKFHVYFLIIPNEHFLLICPKKIEEG